MTTDLLTLYSQLLKPVRIRIIINSPKINNYSNSNLLYNFKAVKCNLLTDIFDFLQKNIVFFDNL